MYRIRPLSAVGMDSSAATRAALIESAMPLFAAQGFEATRTREIADKAKANVSAINYHFGSKMGLYQAVIRHQTEKAHEEHPLDASGMASPDPVVRLRWLVRNMLNRTLGKEADMRLRICMREFTEPTEALDFLVAEVAGPQFDFIRAVVADLLGREVTREELDRHTVSLVGQCLYYGFVTPMLTRLGIKVPESEQEFEELTDHVTRFCLAGFKTHA